jgi:hypothetical protein
MPARAVRVALGAVAALTVPAVLAATPAAAAARKPPPGYRIVHTAVLTLPANSRFSGEVNCPTGTVPWGGGAVTESPDPAVDVADSFPDGRTWVVEVNNATASDTAFQVAAVCAKRPAGYTVVQGTGQLLPAMLEAGATATCPTGTRPLGGGGFTTSGNRPVAINSSGPDGQSWAVEENNGTAVDWGITAFAVCGKPNGYRVVKGAQFTTAAGSRIGSEAICPAPSVVVGGGVFTASSDLQVNVAGTLPGSRTAWDAFIANASPFPATATPEAVCAHA